MWADATFSFQAQRCETIALFDGQLNRPRRSRLRHGHFHPRFLSGITYRGIHGMPRQKESHWIHKRRYWCSSVDDPSAYMKTGWMIGGVCDQMALSDARRN